MNRPRVICHMTTSIDGRIVVDGWPDSSGVRRAYEDVHASYQADGWLCGRVTMEPFAGGVRPVLDDASFTFDDLAAAHRRVEQGAHRGKVVLTPPDVHTDDAEAAT